MRRGRLVGVVVPRRCKLQQKRSPELLWQHESLWPAVRASFDHLNHVAVADAGEVPDFD
jgi:hypothetical protein